MRHVLPRLLLASVFASCANYQYDSELKRQITEEGTRKTESFIRQHFPDATIVEVEPVYFVVFNFISNMTECTLMEDSTEYSIWYNYETDSCITNRYVPLLDSLVWAGAERMGIPDSVVEMHGYTNVLKGQTLSNQDEFLFTTHYDEIRRADVSTEVHAHPWYYNEERVRQLADSLLQSMKQ